MYAVSVVLQFYRPQDAKILGVCLLSNPTETQAVRSIDPNPVVCFFFIASAIEHSRTPRTFWCGSITELNRTEPM